MNIVLGIVGAIAGWFILSIVAPDGITGYNVYRIVAAVVGAGVLIWIGRRLNLQ